MEAYEGKSPLYYDTSNGEVFTIETENGNREIIGAIETDSSEGVKTYPYRFVDIKKADAGANFVTNPYEETDNTIKQVIYPWVIPWYNINGRSYDWVRENDKLINVLANDRMLQFTNDKYNEEEKDEKGNQIIHWLRLIMPQYKRRVEVEDLNRNFWVIGQVLTALSNLLFGDHGYYEMIGLLIEQLLRLWENIMYLWGAAAILSQKPIYDENVVKIVPLPNNIFQPYMKYDDFEQGLQKINSPAAPEVGKSTDEDQEKTKVSLEETVVDSGETTTGGAADNEDKTTEEETESNLPAEYGLLMDKNHRLNGLAEMRIIELLEPYLQQYSQCNLCLIPLIRLNNYDENYYSAEYYPGAFLYDRNTEKPTWEFEPISLLIDLKNEIKNGDKDFNRSKLYSIRKDEYTYYFGLWEKTDSLTYDFIESEDYHKADIYREKVNPKGRYYNLIKTIPAEITIEDGQDSTKERVLHPILKSFKLDLYDIALDVIKKDKDNINKDINNISEENRVRLNFPDSSKIGTYIFTKNKVENNNISGTLTFEEKEVSEDNNFHKPDSKVYRIINFTQGFYQGELISYYKDIEATTKFKEEKKEEEVSEKK